MPNWRQALTLALALTATMGAILVVELMVIEALDRLFL